MAVDDDFTRYLHARWTDLVGGLEDDGVPSDDARLVVAEVLLASRRAWTRRVANEQIDQTLWAEIRERAGLTSLPGAVAPHAARAVDAFDPPGPWLERAGERRSVRRNRRLRLALLACVGAVLAGSGWAWWASLPAPPEVRQEVNQLSVPWYSGDDLHLAEVVVELPGIDAFAATGDDVMARLVSGEVKVVRADGEVDDPDSSAAEVRGLLLAAAAPPEAVVPLGPYDVVLQSVSTQDGGSAHVIDSARRADDGGAVRLSESGRRAVVICDVDGACGPPRTVGAGSQRIRVG